MEKKKFSIWEEWRVAIVLIITFGLQKLTGSIDWSWWWVFSPIWILLGMGVFVFLIAFFWFQISKLFK